MFVYLAHFLLYYIVSLILQVISLADITIFIESPQSTHLGNCKIQNKQDINEANKLMRNHLQIKSLLNTLIRRVESYLSSTLAAV